MKTLLTFPSFKEVFKHLKDEHLITQSKDATDILLFLRPSYYSYLQSLYPPVRYRLTKPLSVRGYPPNSVMMWKGYELSLSMYGMYCCEEIAKRGITKIPAMRDRHFIFDRYFQLNQSNFIVPHWITDEKEMAKIISSHRSFLVQEDEVFYSSLFPEVNNKPLYFPKYRPIQYYPSSFYNQLLNTL